MNQKLIFSRLWMLLLAAVLGLGSCADDNTKSDAFTLYYMSIDDIGQSMTAPLVNPTYHGGTPSDFVIDKVTFDGNSVTGDSFQVNPENGAISVSNTEALSLGVYKVSISCISGGARYSFNDAFVFSLGKLFPESLSASPEVIAITYPTDPLEDNPVAQISTIGECVTTTNFLVIQEKDKEYFSANAQGEVTLNTKFNGEVPPGDYSLTIKLINRGGSKEFSDVVTFKITSAPLELSYAISANKIELGQSFQSAEPNLKGSKDDIVYTITDIAPALTTFGDDINSIISIDPATGVIKANDANSKLAEGEAYKISVKATNKFGTRTFFEVFTLKVVGFIQPVENFSYDASTQTQAAPFTIKKKALFLGDDPQFEFENLATNLTGQIKLDVATGAISAVKGNTIPVGTHNITVKATNAKGSKTATIALTIAANPNYFTYIRYGNNIGVDAMTNANQFRFLSANEMTSFTMPTPTTDCTQPLKWSVKLRHQVAGTTIDTSTGVITPSGYKSNQGGMIVVTATAGTGATEYSVSVPVFFNFPTGTGGTDQGLNITYTPFVFKCNPRTGGTSPAAVTIKTVATGEIYTKAFAMDYRRTFNYYNFNGPASHLDGIPATVGSFLNQMWIKVGYGADLGSRKAVSYYDNIADLTKALLYVNRNNQFKVQVNPGQWVDADDNAANGAFFGQMTCVTNDDGIAVDSGQQTFPLWIWFDEKF